MLNLSRSMLGLLEAILRVEVWPFLEDILVEFIVRLTASQVKDCEEVTKLILVLF